MKSIRGVFFFMNDSYREINTLLKTQKNAKSNVLKERVIATQQKEEETGDTSCREKILSQDFRDFIIPNYWWSAPRALRWCRALALAIV